MPMQFIDNSIKIIGEINEASKRWLLEAANEVASHAQRHCQMAKDGEEIGKQLRGSYEPEKNPDLDSGKIYVGSDMEAAYWEEFGTGSHAEKGDGRPGWWVYVKNGTEHAKKSRTYATREQAEAKAEAMQADGLDAYATNGREPAHTLQNAFIKTNPKAQALLAQILQEGVGQ
jgi:hypothetical protein